MNRRKDIETGKQTLNYERTSVFIEKDFERMGEIKSYKGLRHISGLTVRGQKTKADTEERWKCRSIKKRCK